ncbi:MAG: hypothetical protein WBC44_09685 [Planctomycetaceae bacterium]
MASEVTPLCCTKWLPHALIAVAVLGLTHPARAADPTPQDLAAQLRETLTGLHTIEMQYFESQTFDERTTKGEREWLKSGERLRLIARPGELPRGWWSFDGRYGHNVNYVPGKDGEIRGISKTSTRPAALDMSTPADWLGMRLRGLPSVSLADLLDAPQARIVATESFGDLAAYRVSLGEQDSKINGRWSWTAVVCPERDGLPVEISREPAKSNEQFQQLGITRLVVDDFYEVHDDALERTRWLPQRMRLESSLSTMDLEVTLSLVNHDIQQVAFVPEPQPGTQLIDDTVPGARKVRVYKPEEALAEQAAELAAAANAKGVPPVATSTSPGVTAAPPSNSLWATIGLYGGAVCLLAAAFVYFWRSRQVS